MVEAMPGVENREIRRRYAEAGRHMRLAWAWWWSLLLAPWVSLLFGAGVWGMQRGLSWTPGSTAFALIASVWLAIAAPTAMILRSHCLRASWRGRSLPAERYLRGMLTIWGAIEAGVLVAAVGAMATGVVLPCLGPAAIGWVWLAVLPPNDRAVLR